MKTIGIIGGMSWESSLEYYKILNETVKGKLGKLHSSKIILYSVDFNPISELMFLGEWDKIAEILINAAQSLEKAGADILIIGTNTMHKLVSNIEKHINIPLLHIADATAQSIKKKGLKKVALLGTKYTMEQDFYASRLKTLHKIDVIIPNAKDRESINNIIFNELCLGKINKPSKNEYLRIIKQLITEGAEGIILGCTEIPLLIKQNDVSVPVFDTTTIHANYAIEHALKL